MNFQRFLLLGMCAAQFPFPRPRTTTEITTTTTAVPSTTTTTTTTVPITTTVATTNNPPPTTTNDQPQPTDSKPTTTDKTTFTDSPTSSPNSTDQPTGSLNIAKVFIILGSILGLALIIGCCGMLFLQRKREIEVRESLMDLQATTKSPAIVAVSPQRDTTNYVDYDTGYGQGYANGSAVSSHAHYANAYGPSNGQTYALGNLPANPTSGQQYTPGNLPNGPYPKSAVSVNFQEPIYVDENGVPYSKEETEQWKQQFYK